MNRIIKIMKNKDSLSTENGIESSIPKEKANNSNLYLDETDSNGIQLLKRIEKYPDLSEDEFIPIEYTHSNGIKIISNTYSINKLGEIKNNLRNKIITGNADKRGYIKVGLNFSDNKNHGILVHRIVATVFLKNSDSKIYSIVNHIDHNPRNNKLSNLEWVTQKENTNKANGKSSFISEGKLVQYVALDDNGNEVFRITRKNNKGYKASNITKSIERGKKYEGYYWKVENKREKIILGFSGNLNDYTWYEHWKYPGVYVCKEGFVKYKDKLLYSLNLDGYVVSNIRIENTRIYFKIHRLIMEYLLGRSLKKDEIVDHINTVKCDNSFSNLRLTNAVGNMNNPLTIEKLSKKLILTDLLGNFIEYDSIKNLQGYLRNNKLQFSGVIKSNIISKKYFCINPGDSEILHKKMERVIYILNKNKTKVLSAYSSSEEAEKELEESASTIDKCLRSGNISFKGNYFMRGPEAVKLVLSLGHGTAGDFKPENDKNNTESA